MIKKITIQEIKNAMKDYKFRSNLPSELKEDVQKYEQNPSCPCNLPIYKRVLQHARKELQEYYPGKEIQEYDEKAELEKLSQNNFSVINCHVDNLETEMRRLPPGRKQIAITRFEDQVTVVVNELDLAFIP